MTGQDMHSPGASERDEAGAGPHLLGSSSDGVDVPEVLTAAGETVPISEINPEKIARDGIVVGASAGGIRAVIELLSRLPADLPAFVGVVIHRGAASTSDWSTSLGMRTKLRVVEPADGDALTRGVVYIAPADCHMKFEHETITLDGGAKEHRTRPAVDPLSSPRRRSRMDHG